MHVWPIRAFGTKGPNRLSKKEEGGKMRGQEGQIKQRRKRENKAGRE